MTFFNLEVCENNMLPPNSSFSVHQSNSLTYKIRQVIVLENFQSEVLNKNESREKVSFAAMSSELELRTLHGGVITLEVMMETTLGELKTMLLEKHQGRTMRWSANSSEQSCFVTVRSWRWMMLRHWAQQGCSRLKHQQLSSTKETKWKLQQKSISIPWEIWANIFTWIFPQTAQKFPASPTNAA